MILERKVRIRKYEMRCVPILLCSNAHAEPHSHHTDVSSVGTSHDAASTDARIRATCDLCSVNQRFLKSHKNVLTLTHCFTHYRSHKCHRVIWADSNTQHSKKGQRAIKASVCRAGPPNGNIYTAFQNTGRSNEYQMCPEVSLQNRAPHT